MILVQVATDEGKKKMCRPPGLALFSNRYCFLDYLLPLPLPGKLTDKGLIGRLVANDTKVSHDTLVQLFCLSSSAYIGSRYEYEKTTISG